MPKCKHQREGWHDWIVLCLNSGWHELAVESYKIIEYFSHCIRCIIFLPQKRRWNPPKLCGRTLVPEWSSRLTCYLCSLAGGAGCPVLSSWVDECRLFGNWFNSWYSDNLKMITMIISLKVYALSFLRLPTCKAAMWHKFTMSISKLLPRWQYCQTVPCLYFSTLHFVAIGFWGWTQCWHLPTLRLSNPAYRS